MGTSQDIRYPATAGKSFPVLVLLAPVAAAVLGLLLLLLGGALRLGGISAFCFFATWNRGAWCVYFSQAIPWLWKRGKLRFVMETELQKQKQLFELRRAANFHYVRVGVKSDSDSSHETTIPTLAMVL